MTLSPQAAGDAIFLEAVKEAPESGFSGLYLTASAWLLRRQTSGPAPKASIPESGPCVSLHFLSLANIFLGQSSIAQEESGCESVFEDTGCHTGVNLVKGTLQL